MIGELLDPCSISFEVQTIIPSLFMLLSLAFYSSKVEALLNQYSVKNLPNNVLHHLLQFNHVHEQLDLTCCFGEALSKMSFPLGKLQVAAQSAEFVLQQ